MLKTEEVEVAKNEVPEGTEGAKATEAKAEALPLGWGILLGWDSYRTYSANNSTVRAGKDEKA